MENWPFFSPILTPFITPFENAIFHDVSSGFKPLTKNIMNDIDKQKHKAYNRHEKREKHAIQRKREKQ